MTRRRAARSIRGAGGEIDAARRGFEPAAFRADPGGWYTATGPRPAWAERRPGDNRVARLAGGIRSPRSGGSQTSVLVTKLHRHRLQLWKMSRNSEYTTRQPVTACHAASSWHTIGIAEVS